MKRLLSILFLWVIISQCIFADGVTFVASAPSTVEVGSKFRVQFTVNNRRRWDIDNRLKALLDCFEMGGVIKDDTQISGIIAKRVEGETSQTQIEMSEYTGMCEKSSNRG